MALYVNDRQQSVHYMTTGSGTVNATVVYDSFGQITSNSNPTLTDRYTYIRMFEGQEKMRIPLFFALQRQAK